MTCAFDMFVCAYSNCMNMYKVAWLALDLQWLPTIAGSDALEAVPL